MSKTKGSISVVVLGIVAGLVILSMLLFGWVTGTYNNLVTQRETVDTQWSQVETQYQRRFDLIDQLVGATRGTLAQEREVFGKIAEARTRYAGAPSGSKEQFEAAGELEGFFSRLLVIMENYPVLQSNTTVIALMDEIAGTENRVGVARLRYNETTRDYNITIMRFPTNILAGVFNFDEMPLYESEEGAEVAPEVDLESGL